MFSRKKKDSLHEPFPSMSEQSFVSPVITDLRAPIKPEKEKKDLFPTVTKLVSAFKKKDAKEKAPVLPPRANAKPKKWYDIEFGRVVPESELLQVTRQMAAFTSAGIPIVDAIEMLAKTSKNKNMKSTLYGVADEIRNGASLSTAVGMYPKVFPKFYIAILEASDRSGDIAITFQNLTAYIERDYTSKRTIKSALYYPAILLVIAILAIFILSIVVLPKFEVFFSSLNAKLPLPTRMLLNFSNFMQHDWWLVAAVIIGAIVAVWAYRKTPAGLFQTDALLLKLPIFGRVLEIISLERFTRVLGSLANAGVPLPEALELSSKVVSNEVYLRAINFVREGVIAGRGFIDPLEETKVFPEEIQQILRVGEQTGRLVEQLEFASQYYSKEVDYRLKNVSTLIEPIILVFVGGGVGFVAVALVSAMYGIYSSNALGQ